MNWIRSKGISIRIYWQGISVYEPERKENGEILWHLRRNPSNKLKNIITSEFTMATRFERASHKLVTSNDTKKFAHEEEHLTIVQTEKSKRRRQFIRERSTAKLKLQHHRSPGFGAQESC